MEMPLAWDTPRPPSARRVLSKAGSHPPTPDEEPGELWICSPCNGHPVGIRLEASLDGEICASLLKNDTFRVTSIKQHGSGVKFLKLADGRGWVPESRPDVGEMCRKVTASSVVCGADVRVEESLEVATP